MPNTSHRANRETGTVLETGLETSGEVRLSRIFTSSAPWIVGREPLLEDAIGDFLHEMTRQKPWLRARYEALLTDFSARIDAELGSPAPLEALTHERVHTWLGRLPSEQRALAEGAVNGFADYLVKWGWLEAHPLRQPQAV